MPIKNFKELIVWQMAHKLVLFTYSVTQKFPKQELFALTSQMRRASISITSNIAEGFSRESYKDKNHFYIMSAGSLTELQNQYEIGHDLGYISAQEYTESGLQFESIHRLLNGLIKKSKTLYT